MKSSSHPPAGLHTKHAPTTAIKCLTILLNKVILHHKGTDYTFPRTEGAVEIPESEMGNLPEVVALLLVLLSGAKRLYIAKETYFALREAVWFHLDLKEGGLKASAKELFEDEEDVLRAGELHRMAFRRKPKRNKTEG